MWSDIHCPLEKWRKCAHTETFLLRKSGMDMRKENEDSCLIPDEL